ncbi:MAG TPA: GGDEF domain-containing protein [Kineosporiaceae bacterium]|nr:GGDEF domain-containing protein [Kineosporiaceae bacterium]
MARTAHQYSWLRAAERLARRRRRILVTAVGPEAATSAIFLFAGVAGLPGRAGWQDLLVGAAFAWSAWATWSVAVRRTGQDAYAGALLGAIVGLAVAALVGPPGGPATTGLPFVVLLATAAPYLRAPAVAALGTASGATDLGVLVVTGRPGVAESWLTLVITLVVVVGLARSARADRLLLGQLVDLEARDRVTGLPNGRYLRQAAEQAFAVATPQAPLAVLAIEVDGLTALERAHGVRVRDQVIAAVARGVRRGLRDDHVVTRADDGVLVALLPGLDEPLAWDVARTLRIGAAERTARLPGVTVSVGLVVHPDVDLPAPAVPSAARLIALARDALADAEAEGGDRVKVVGRSWPSRSGAGVARAAHR